MFLEPKNVCVSLGSHHIPHWGLSLTAMSLYQMQKFLFDINRDRGVQAQFRADPPRCSSRYELSAEERGALDAGDIGLIYVLGRQRPAADALCRVPRHAVGRLHRRHARGRRHARSGARRHLCT